MAIRDVRDRFAETVLGKRLQNAEIAHQTLNKCDNLIFSSTRSELGEIQLNIVTKKVQYCQIASITFSKIKLGDLDHLLCLVFVIHSEFSAAAVT